MVWSEPKEVNNMEEKKNEIDTLIPRKILVPIEDKEPELTRPSMSMKSNNHTPEQNNFVSSNKNNEFQNKFNNFMKEFSSNDYSKNFSKMTFKKDATMNTQPQQPQKLENEKKSTESTSKGNAKPNPQNTKFFRFPNQEIPVGGSSQLVHWKNPVLHEVIPVQGSESQYVRFANWHLNGAKVWIGTSATNATQEVGLNPATGVTGLIPLAIQELAQLTESARRLSPNKLDAEQREFQFGIVCVLGGQDHAALLRQTKLHNMTNQYTKAFRAAGVPNASLKASLYNDNGKLIAFEVDLGNATKYGTGRHLLFLHPANDIGGGKSDESLTDGRLSFQASSLGREFEWWKAALEFGNGRIGSIETTLGGTARLGRYALLAARIPRTLFAKDATEILNVDRADWVTENIQSQVQEYRANYATTLLRTAWGKAGTRFHDIPVTLVDRFNDTMRMVHRTRSSIALMRELFLGHPDMDLLRGDISDERIAISREQAITESDYMTIHDTVKDPKGPWQQRRRIRMSTSIEISRGKLLSMARAENPQTALDDAEIILEGVRGLATSKEGALPSGGFIVIDALVPNQLLESGTGFTQQSVNRAIELLGKGLESKGAEKILINLYKVPAEFSDGDSAITVQVTEDQPGTNVLMVSTEEVKTHEKRTILQNPNLDSITDTTVSQVFGFGRLLGRMVTAHLDSGYHHCVDDGELILAFHRHYYGGNFGNRPDILPGGNDRKRKKEEKK